MPPVSSAAGSLIIDADELVDRVRRDFGITLSSIAQIYGGQDSAAVVLKAVTDTGSEMAIKASRHLQIGSLRTQAELAGHISPGVPAPLVARTGMPYSITGGITLSVTPWVAGRGAYSTGLDPDQWRAFGKLLAKAHATPIPTNLAASELPTEDYRTPAAADARALDARIGAQSAQSDDPTTAALVRSWRAARTSIATILEQIDDLGDALRADPAPVVICHGDAHLGNVQIGDDGNLWLIDWDGAVSAPRERDLMFVVIGVLARPVTEAQQRWFLQGYGDVDISPIRLAYYRCSWAIQDVVDFAARVLDQLPDQPESRAAPRAEALDFFRGVVSSKGIVPLAVQSLRSIGRTVVQDEDTDPAG